LPLPAHTGATTLPVNLPASTPSRVHSTSLGAMSSAAASGSLAYGDDDVSSAT